MSEFADSPIAAADPPFELPPGFPFPPVTLPTYPWPEDETARDDALDYGRRHDEALAALDAFGAQFGGGLLGKVKGFLALHEREGLISARDRERLTALFEAFSGTDQEAGAQRILHLHDEMANDPDSKPVALQISSIAAGSARRALLNEIGFIPNTWVAGYADAVGLLYGAGMGAGVAIAMEITASDIAGHVRVGYY